MIEQIIVRMDYCKYGQKQVKFIFYIKSYFPPTTQISDYKVLT